MDFSAFMESIQETLGSNLPVILGALAVLVVGWLVAILVRAGVRKGLGMLRVNERIRSATGKEMALENGLAKGAYYLILLLVLVAFFNVLSLDLASRPLQSLVDQIFAFAPRIAAALLLALVAWLLATILRRLTTKALSATTLDEKLSTTAGMPPLSESLGNVLYWMVLVLFIPGILGALGMEGLLSPVMGMVDEGLAMIPNLVAAIAIGVVGWFLARVVRDLLSNLLTVLGVDEYGRKAGLRESFSLSRLIGVVAYIFILVPALIAALDALKIEAISGPATTMLSTFLAAVPNLFAAVLILGLTYFVARFVAGLLTNLLEGVGFNELPGKLGLGKAMPADWSLASFAGKVVIFFAMVFAVVEAANRLGFDQISELVATFTAFGGQVLLGVVIIAVGLWISNLAYTAIRGLSSGNSTFLAGLARFGILGLVLAMGLRAMGIADSIVNLAFGMTLGSIAVAVALMFGLGGREAAGKQMEHWFGKLRQGGDRLEGQGS